MKQTEPKPGTPDEIQSDWDLEHAEKREPARRPRAVVSVAFPRDDFELVEAGAKAQGKKLSEFIREAALARAKISEPVRPIVTFGGISGGSFFSPDVSLQGGGTRAGGSANTTNVQMEATDPYVVVE